MRVSQLPAVAAAVVLLAGCGTGGEDTRAERPRGQAETHSERARAEGAPVPLQITLEEVRAGVRATAPLLSESAEVDHAQAVKLVDWMYEQGMIERRVPVSEQNGGGEN